MSTRVLLVLAAAVGVLGPTASAYSDAPVGRYTLANGTVYDTKTRLTWQQTVSATKLAWSDAKTYCAGLSLAGTGWRLPTAKELQTIVDESRKKPAIDPNAFPSTPSGYFWTSSKSASSSTSAWRVFFDDGYTASYDVSYTGPVRCVR